MVRHQAEKYADLAIRQDRYNAMALVNKGNCLFVKNEFGKAKELYLEAIGTDTCEEDGSDRRTRTHARKTDTSRLQRPYQWINQPINSLFAKEKRTLASDRC